MNYSDYQERIKDFAVYPRIGNNLSYAVLGLINEFGELIEKMGEFDAEYFDDSGEIKDEGGDCFWYIGACYNEIEESWGNILVYNSEYYETACGDVSDILENEEEVIIGLLSILFGKLAGYAKKADRDNNGKLLDRHRSDFIRILLTLQAILSCSLERYGILATNAMKDNLSKLQSRKERNMLHGDGDKR